jgi:pilus assembly protein Flp/PilA
MRRLVRSLVNPFILALAVITNIMVKGIIQLYHPTFLAGVATFISLDRAPGARPGRSLVVGHSRGQGMLEYALIIALVAVVVIAGLVLLGPQIAGLFNQVNNNL